VNATCTIPTSLEAMLRDDAENVRRSALRRWRSQLRSSPSHQVCGLLWSIGALDEFDATALATCALDDERHNVRKMAQLALRGLHPLLGIPTRLAVRDATEPSTKMRDWIAPRRAFETTISDMLSDPVTHLANLVEGLGEFDGESPRISVLLERLTNRHWLDAYLAIRTRRRVTAPQLIIALTQRCSRNCSYCYIAPLERRSGEAMAWDTLLSTLDWAESNGVERVSFTGGEPTEYSRFADLMQEVKRRRLRVYLNTHGLLTPEALAALRTPAVTRVGIHVGSLTSYRTGELVHLRECARALTASGLDLFIRFTQYRTQHEDTEWLLQLADELTIRHINWAYAFPTPWHNNGFLPLDWLTQAKPELFQLLSSATERGICVRIAKPLPLCLFTRAEYARYQRQHQLASTCTIHENQGLHNLVVQTNGHTWPCVGLPSLGPRLVGRDLDRIRTHCRTQIGQTLERLRSDCHDCPIVALGACQRACLAHGITSALRPQSEVCT
jgi:sulfatase maturation enzyme AslB (radical SAM superfamily)